METRYIEMQVCSIYNNTLCAVPNEDSQKSTLIPDIEASLKSLCECITKIQSHSNKNNSESLAEKLRSLQERLLWIDGPTPPAISAAQRCIVVFSRFFVRDSNKIMNLNSKQLGKIVGTLENMMTLLENVLSNSFSSEKSTILKRMEIIFTKASQFESEQVPEASAKENHDIVNYYTPPTGETFFINFGFFSCKNKTGESRADALRKVAQKYNLICKNVAGDGNCFFTAIALHLKGKYPNKYESISLTSLAIKLRQDILKHISSNRNKYEAFMYDMNFDDWIKAMKNPKEWCDEHTIIALAETLKMSVVIVRSDGKEPHVYRNPNAGKDDVICLGYEVPVHYQLLCPKPEYGGHLPEAIQQLIKSSEFMMLNSLPTMQLTMK